MEECVQQILDRYIVIDQAVCHGRPHIAGRRIKVQDIAIWRERLGLGVDEIGTDYDLSLAEIYAALSYYLDHKASIDEAIATDQSLVTSHQREQESGLQARLSQLRDH